jgi:hypothetical protein
MNDYPGITFHSAKAVADYYSNKEVEAKKKQADAIKAKQLESEKIALLKESNKFAEQTLTTAKLNLAQVSTIHKVNRADVVEMKPNFFGFGLNLNEAWRRFRKSHLKQNT